MDSFGVFLHHCHGEQFNYSDRARSQQFESNRQKASTNTQDDAVEYRNNRDIRNWYEPNKELNRVTTYNQAERRLRPQEPLIGFSRSSHRISFAWPIVFMLISLASGFTVAGTTLVSQNEGASVPLGSVVSDSPGESSLFRGPLRGELRLIVP